MAWVGNEVRRQVGDYSGPNAFLDIEQAGIDILPEDQDRQGNDHATDIAECVNRLGKNSAGANLPMAGFKHTNVADATANNQYATLKQLNERHGFVPASSVSGTGDAIVLTPSPVYSAYITGMVLYFFVKTANTGVVNVNVNGLGVKDIKKSDGSSLSAGDFSVGLPVRLIYNGTNFRADSSASVDTSSFQTEPEVDARVVAGTQVWARAGNTSDIPDSKLSSNVQLAPFDLDADTTVQTSSLADTDRFVIADYAVSGNPNRYLTGAQLKEFLKVNRNINGLTSNFTLTTTEQDVVTVNITPSSSSAKIKVTVSADTIGIVTYYKVYRGSTELTNSQAVGIGGQTALPDDPFQFSVYDAPNTTSSVTYKLRASRSSGTGNVYLGKGATWIQVEEI